ncbi:transposase, IS605 OrfB family protein [Galbibacter marinus]|uniref:Transposase, IS605 OrfB family protein n=1 Tax=Galbibacter marinus TaxID=555500 RepID=K2Q1S8_9FLAO|nr:transposase, IS605 OrfB family protein [Galbibacter marinus]
MSLRTICEIERELVKVDRFYPSSKTCSVCGWINEHLNLSTRQWTCKNGHVLDRDHNARINILNEGLKIHRLGRSFTKVERSNKTTSVAPLDEARSPSCL